MKPTGSRSIFHPYIEPQIVNILRRDIDTIPIYPPFNPDGISPRPSAVGGVPGDVPAWHGVADETRCREGGRLRVA